MAVVLGTNAGFVETAPVADPAGVNDKIDNHVLAVKDTAPVGAGKITEVGWWCDGATQETNFEVGLYDHNAVSDKPGNRLYVAAVNAKGTDAGWKTVAVDWVISAETVYWIAIQVDYTATTTNINASLDGTRASAKSPVGALGDPWPATSIESALYCYAVYAVWGEATIELTGTIPAVSIVSGYLDVSSGWKTISIATIKRLVVAGNDEIWYEDI